MDDPIIINATPTLCHVDDSDGWILNALEEFLSFEDAANQFVMVRGQVRKRTNTPKLRLLNLIDHTFPTGLLPMVCRHLRELDIAYEVREHFEEVEITDHPLDWLRPEQKEAVDRSLLRKRGILWIPTGGGKTEIAIGLSLKVKTKWLFIVHKKDLLHQTAERYEKRTGLKAGRIGDGIFDVRVFTVATFQTLARGLKKGNKDVVELLNGMGAVVHDECHTAPASSSMSVMLACKNAAYRYGLSGTPLARGDKRSIFAIGMIGPVIFRIHPDVLIKAGLLAKPIIQMFKLTQESTKPTWQGVYGEAVVRSAKRNKVLTDCAVICEKPALLFVKEIKHGHILEERLRKAGVSCEFLWGDKQTAKRNAAVKRLVKGDTDVLIVSVIFQEGTDIPSLRSLIIGSAGKSVIAAVQRVGRGMRIHEDKKDFFVYDIYDEGHRTLKKWAKARKAAYKAESYDIEVI